MQVCFRRFQGVFYFLTVFSIISISSVLWARPQYAVGQGTVSCTVCHTNPAGGGVRTVYGKLFQARHSKSHLVNPSSLFGADFRVLGYYPTTQMSHKRSGLALMSAIGTANVPVSVSDAGSELRFVLSYDFSTSASPRDVYVRYRSSLDGGWIPRYIVLGKFQVPFGLLTDEHRTYVRMQNNTSFLNYDLGVLLSGDPSGTIHYDLAITQGYRLSGGSSMFFVNNNIQWGSVANIRWMPAYGPVFLGVSGDYLFTKSGAAPWAASAYGALSFDKISHHIVKGSWLLEAVYAKYWNANMSKEGFFIDSGSSPNYNTAVSKTPSLGLYSRFDFELLPWLTFIYKLDALVLDTEFIADTYYRHGVGFNINLNPYFTVLTRLEKAIVGRSGIAATGVLAAQDAGWVMAQLTF